MSDAVRVQEWRRDAQTKMRAYAAAKARVEALQAEANRLLGEAVRAYEWLADVAEPERPDVFGAQRLGGHSYGEDVVGELQLADHCGEGYARATIGQVGALMHSLPLCWARVIDPDVRVPLWVACRIVGHCVGLNKEQLEQVDAEIAPKLGVMGRARLVKIVAAAVKHADPNGARARTQTSPRARFVWVRPDVADELSMWVTARVDTKDAVLFEDTVKTLAGRLAEEGDTRSLDQRRASVYGLLANPAAAVERFGIITTTGMTNPPVTEAQAQTILDAAHRMAPAFTPRTQLYVHMFRDSIGDADGIARVEGIGPVLADQLRELTGASQVRVTPVVDLGKDITADAYEIPARIHEQVRLSHPFIVSPWGTNPSRGQDVDHIVSYRDGGTTKPSNLAPQGRGPHRWRTTGGWHFSTIWPGTYLWISAAGQAALVDQTGTHPLPPPRE